MTTLEVQNNDKSEFKKITIEIDENLTEILNQMINSTAVLFGDCVSKLIKGDTNPSRLTLSLQTTDLEDLCMSLSLVINTFQRHNTHIEMEANGYKINIYQNKQSQKIARVLGESSAIKKLTTRKRSKKKSKLLGSSKLLGASATKRIFKRFPRYRKVGKSSKS